MRHVIPGTFGLLDKFKVAPGAPVVARVLRPGRESASDQPSNTSSQLSVLPIAGKGTVDVKALDGRLFRDVPVLAPYVKGNSGTYSVPERGALCLVVFAGLTQPFVVGFFNSPQDTGSFRSGRQPLVPGDQYFASTHRGTELLLSAGGTVFLAAGNGIFMQMVDADDSWLIVGRNRVENFGFYTETLEQKTDTDLKCQYRLAVSERSPSSNQGPGSVYEVRRGTVDDDGQPFVRDPTTRLIDKEDWGPGKLVRRVYSDGKLIEDYASDVELNANKGGFTPATVVGVTPGPFFGPPAGTLSFTATGRLETVLITQPSLTAFEAAILINRSTRKVVASVTAAGTLQIVTKKTGVDVAITGFAGAWAVPMGLAGLSGIGTNGLGSAQSYTITAKTTAGFKVGEQSFAGSVEAFLKCFNATPALAPGVAVSSVELTPTSVKIQLTHSAAPGDVTEVEFTAAGEVNISGASKVTLNGKSAGVEVGAATGDVVTGGAGGTYPFDYSTGLPIPGLADFKAGPKVP